MLNWLIRKVKKRHKGPAGKVPQGDSTGPVELHPLSASLAKNKAEMQKVFDRCSDIVMREFELGSKPPVKVMVVYLDGLVSAEKLHQDVLKSLMLLINEQWTGNIATLSETIQSRFLPVGGLNISTQLVEVTKKILAGQTMLFIDGVPQAIGLSIMGWEQRSVDEPQTEPVVRGPREGFIENVKTNLVLVRKRLKTSRLKVEDMTIGLLSKTDVKIVYVEGIADPKMVQEVKSRLSRINTDIILESGYLEEYISDNWYSPFPQIQATERPDKVAAGLAEGQVGVMVDGTPFVLLMPITFFHLMQASEDYYARFQLGTFLRLLRIAAINVALLLPSVYIAVATYHQEMIPTQLLLSIAKAREGVPFPAFVEAMMMEITFEFLREAGVRLPRQVGQAISIVGALVIGQAAVAAGLVSPVMVIVVSLTAISSFAIPNYSAGISLRLLRFPIMFMAAGLGLFGIMAALMAILIHLCSLRSFGIPYVAPLSPFIFQDWKDFLIRMPVFAMFNRPKLIGYEEPGRQDYLQVPLPPKRRRRGGKRQ